MAYKIKAGYAVVSGKTHRVVARTKKLTTARKRAAGLVRRGSKRVSIMRRDWKRAVERSLDWAREDQACAPE